MKKIISILVFVFIFVNIPITVEAVNNLTEYKKARVITVLDGDAVVALFRTKDEAYTEKIKLIGIKANGDNNAFLYTKRELLGKNIKIVYDDNELPVSEEYNNAYIYTNEDISFNEKILTEGIVDLDTSYKNAKKYNDLEKAYISAKNYNKGIHDIKEAPKNIININLAPVNMLRDHFGIDTTVANKIVVYRQNNPINNIYEVGFLDEAFSREFIEKNKSGIHFVTNINEANLYELTSLFGDLKSDFGQKIKTYRMFNEIKKTEDLKEIDDFTNVMYKDIKNYISLEKNYNYLDKDVVRVNLNTATEGELYKIKNITEKKAKEIIEFRNRYNYPFFSLEELGKNNYPLAGIKMSQYTDKLVCVTDINNAPESEIRSLFSIFHLSGSEKSAMVKKVIEARPIRTYDGLGRLLGEYYDKLAPFVKIDEVERKSKRITNPNLIDKEEFIEYLDMSKSEARKYTNRSIENYTHPSKLPNLPKDKRSYVSLYLNINTATYDELKELSEYMYDTTVQALINYREEYPIYNDADLKNFFKKQGNEYVYNRVRDYIVYY